MKTSFRSLPPLSALVFFEAAARQGSFTKAAAELFVTQSAVSKQIQMLEENLGVALFSREPRMVQLTEAGLEFQSDIVTIFQNLNDSVARIRRWPGGNSVTVICTHAVSHYWLFPRITRFNMEHPGITINIYAVNEVTEQSCLQFDLGILNGNNQWRVPLESHLLFKERIYPVCHADYPLKGNISPEDLYSQRLIHLDPNAWHWPTWVDWFANFGIDYAIPKNAQLFNQVTLALNATLQGMGIGLGWEFMTEELLRKGEIRRVSHSSYVTGIDDYLVHSRSKPLTETARTFKQWLLDNVS